MHLIDTHAHLDDEQFDVDRDAVVARAMAAGVERIVTVGCTRESSEKSVRLAECHPPIWAAVGLQPNYCGQAEAGDWEAIVELANHPRVAAIGETGLDRYWDHSPFDIQERYFELHLQLSRKTQLPFIVHMRDCGEDVIRMLRAEAKNGPLLGVMHSFTGDESLVEECVELGMYISYAGMVTFKKSVELRNTIKRVPMDRLLVETDSPYLSPHPHRGRRPNEPALVAHTAACLAAELGLSAADLADQTTANAERLFRFDRTPPS